MFEKFVEVESTGNEMTLLMEGGDLAHNRLLVVQGLLFDLLAGLNGFLVKGELFLQLHGFLDLVFLVSTFSTILPVLMSFGDEVHVVVFELIKALSWVVFVFVLDYGLLY